ncbi:PID-CTERM protein-sorting domain-containing protein [Yeosuana sp. AK3]
MNIQNKRLFASILFVLISFVCVAQKVPPPPTPPPPPGLPIDGGILLGVFVALFYGTKKLLKSK